MLTIITCIKYIRSELVTTSQKTDYQYAMNPYDLNMLEQLMRFKKAMPCRIIGVTMGPIGCKEALQRSKAFGLDDVYLASDPAFSGSDTYATSYIIHRVLDYIGKADIYAFGEKAIDGETAQVPIGVAGRMGLHCIIGVTELQMADGNRINLKRRDANYLEIIEASMPCVLSFHGFSTNEPQISLLSLKQARKYTPYIIDAKTLNIAKQDCGQSGSRTVVKNIVKTINERKAEIVEGTSQQKTDVFQKLITEGRVRI